MGENVVENKIERTINADVSIKYRTCEKDHIWNPATCSCKNCKYLSSTNNDLAITCDEIINLEIKTTPRNFYEKKITRKTHYFYVLIAFLLITLALLIAVGICHYLIKCKQ